MLRNIDNLFVEKVKNIVYTILNKNNMFQGNWHLGKVDRVVSSTRIYAFVDGASTSQLIACNPDVSFTKGDEIWIVFINNDSKNKFAISKRGI